MPTYTKFDFSVLHVTLPTSVFILLKQTRVNKLLNKCCIGRSIFNFNFSEILHVFEKTNPETGEFNKIL